MKRITFLLAAIMLTLASNLFAMQFNTRSEALATLNAGCASTDTTITLSAGQGAKCPPQPVYGLLYNSTDYVYATSDPFAEIIQVQSVATDTLTITRGALSTFASAHNTGGKTYKLAYALPGQTSQAAQSGQHTTTDAPLNQSDFGSTGVKADVITNSTANTSPTLKALGTGMPQVQDSSGNNLLTFVKTASAVDNVAVTNGAAGTPGIVSATAIGTDTNIAMLVAGKGTGQVQLGQATSTGVELMADQAITDSSNNKYIGFTKTSSAVDFVNITNGAAGTPGNVVVAANGTDTNVKLTLSALGNGNVNLGQATCSGMNLLGDQPLQDSSGNPYLAFVKTGTAVDGFTLTNAATANPASPTLSATGTDSNINFVILPKGTGSAQTSVGGSTSTGGIVVQANRQLSIAGVGNGADATDDTLFTYSLPANALKNSGDYVRVVCWGKSAATSHTTTAKLWFGTTAVVASGNITNSSAFPIRLAMTVVKTGSSTQLEFIDYNLYGSTTVQNAAVVPATDSQTDTSAIVIKMTGSSASSAANDVLGQGFIVEIGHQ